jgi:hypothetical protein
MSAQRFCHFGLQKNHGRAKLCDACENIKLQVLRLEEYRHSYGYQKLVSSAKQCDFCRLMRDGLRNRFISNSKGLFSLSNKEALDTAILGSVLHGNPFSPGFPGWVSFSKLGKDQNIFTVWVSADAWCTVEIFTLPRR